ncbi:F-box protein At4g22390-like [Hevea brasiliensis]|uniref:F-box protein At4g22390-like n=1 Tax=Hevea brasiliensis TaxID=3981 RepID=UPI0025E5A936|nr:F-box protein At4g22390-like [Hevea brasiliensis]
MKNVHRIKAFKGLKRFANIVSTYNGVFYLSDDVYGKYTDRAALWNPSVRKIIAIPGPNVTFASHGPYIHSLGFGFDSTTDDFKLVSVVYLQDSDFNFYEIPPLVEIYSLRSRCWRMVHNDMRYAILECSTSAFLNGACNWVAPKRQKGAVGGDVIVSFALGEEVFGEMEVPDLFELRACYNKRYRALCAKPWGLQMVLSSTKYEIEKFDGGSSLWKAIEDNFPKCMKEAEKADLKERALSAIFMSVTDNILREIASESSASTAWKKL